MSLPMTNASVLRFVSVQAGETSFENILTHFEKDPQPRHHERLRRIVSGLIDRGKIVGDGKTCSALPVTPPKSVRKRKLKTQSAG